MRRFFLVFGIILIFSNPIFAETKIYSEVNSTGPTYIKQTIDNETFELNSSGETYFTSNTTENKTEINVNSTGTGQVKIDSTKNHSIEARIDKTEISEKGQGIFSEVYNFFSGLIFKFIFW